MTPRPRTLLLQGMPGGPLVPLALALLVGAPPLYAQDSAASGADIEALSALRGIPLPAGYWDLIRERPDHFELPNGLWRRSPAAAAARALADAPPARVAALEGEARIPVVLALFADSRQPPISREQVRASLFTGPAPSGTVSAFYQEMSGGRFRLTGDVAPWVRTSLTMAEVVGDSYGLGGTARVRPYLVEALTLADEHVDFALYDSDGPDGVPNSGDDDGVVDAVAFEFLEIAASCGGPGVWPHRSGVANWGGGPFFTKDVGADGVPIIVNGYIIQSVADCTGEQVQTAATIAHEYGHVLGLPDFYHPHGGPLPENRRWVLGCWELMAAGAWGCGPVDDRHSFGPTQMMAPQKAELGWATLDTIRGEVWDREVVLEPVQTSARAVVVPLTDDGSESLVLEYRQRVGFDAVLPAAGVLVTHQDERGSLRPQQSYRYFRRLVEADGNRGLVRDLGEGGNRGEAGDAFAAGGTVGELHALTTPSLVANATGLPTYVAIHSMRVVDGRAHVRLSTGRTPRVVAPGAPALGSVARPMASRFTVAGGIMPYTVIDVAGAPEGVEARVDGDDLLLSGAPQGAGAFEMVLRLGDSQGMSFEASLPVRVSEFFVENERLLQPILRNGAEALSPEERAHLDGVGNRNGRFDVGDVRAWLLGG